jgi:hypothetical protein
MKAEMALKNQRMSYGIVKYKNQFPDKNSVFESIPGEGGVGPPRKKICTLQELFLPPTLSNLTANIFYGTLFYIHIFST